MKNALITCLSVCVCIGSASAQVRVPDVPARRAMAAVTASTDAPARAVPRRTRSTNASPVLEENLRVVLLIQRPDREPLSMSVVTAHDRVTLETLAGVADIDGNAVPVIIKFQASIEPLGAGEYFLSYDLGANWPAVTSVSTSKGGVQKSSVQYHRVGAEASVRIGMNKAITILKDPDKEVRLELQSVDE